MGVVKGEVLVGFHHAVAMLPIAPGTDIGGFTCNRMGAFVFGRQIHHAAAAG